MVVDGEVATLDGVAALARGDLILVVYQRPARLHRTRWLFDFVDQVVARSAGGIAVLMVILPTADPPDGPTRAENTARFKKVGAALRRIVTVPIGDAFRMSVVRTIMRAIAIMQGKFQSHLVTDTIEVGITRVLEGASARTPGRSLILGDLRAMYLALGEDPPRLGSSASAHPPA